MRPWREQFQAFGVSGKKHPSSIEAVLRRALKPESEPFFINPLVDFYNTISLEHTVPAGAFDLDQIESLLELRLTRAGDTFHALDADSPVDVEPDEMGYVAGSTVLTRHIMWRQSRQGLVTLQTTSLILLSEVLRDFDIPDARIANVILHEFTSGMRKRFGVESTPFIVSPEQPEIEWQMTKLAILADIHGNLPALEAVWDDLGQFDVDQVVVAGDVINWGPFSREVLEFLTERHCAIIRGNHEYYLLDYDTPRAPEEWARLTGSRLTGPRWIHHQIGDTWRSRIAAWPDTISLRFPDTPPLRVVHGSPGNHWKGIYPNTTGNEIKTMLESVEESTVIAAHTHLALDRTVDRWHIVNPGSVGNPFDGILDASYLLLEFRGNGWRATHRRIPFDRERVIRELERQNLIAEHDAFGQLVIEEFRTARQHVGPFMLWRKSCHPDEPLSMEMAFLEEFTDEVRWAHTWPAYHVNR